MARPASPPRPCRDRTVSKATLPGRACTDKVDRRTRALRAWENAMVFLGIDVSKGRLDCAVLAAEGGRSPGRRSFRNDVEGAERAATWTAQVSDAAAADTHVILEATAAYHEPVAHRLAALGMRVSIVNPAQVRSFAKGIGVLGKTDRGGFTKLTLGLAQGMESHASGATMSERPTACPVCGGTVLIRSGHACGRQRWRCKGCGRQFTRTTPRGKSAGMKAAAVELYCTGLSLSAVGKRLGVSA